MLKRLLAKHCSSTVCHRPPVPEPELKPLDVSSLSDCRLIAAENYAFYEHLYDRIVPHFDKDVLGRVMAQKKEFMDVVQKLVASQSMATAAVIPSTQDVFLSLPAKPMEEQDPARIREFVQIHESRFEEALELTLNQLEDATIVDVMRHHRDAAFLALQAMFETSCASRV